MFQKILVPVDGSPNSFRGVKYAADIAAKYESEITLIHVVQFVDLHYPVMTSSPPPDYYSRREEFGKELLAKRKKELEGKGIKSVKTLLVTGVVSEQILKASKGRNLIVIGSRGLGTFKALLLGSVSMQVLQHSKIPVLVVR